MQKPDIRSEIGVRAIFFLTFAAFASWMPFFNLYLVELGFSKAQIGAVFGMMPLCSVFNPPFWGRMADAFGRKKILIIASVISSLLLLGFLFYNSFWFFIGYVFVFAFFHNPLGPLVDSVGLDHLEVSKRSSYGELRMWSSLGWGISAFTLGLLLKKLAGQENMIFVIASGLLVLNLLLIIFTVKNGAYSRKSAPEFKFKNFTKLISEKRLLTILIIFFFYGISATPIYSLYNLYLKDIGADFDLIGIAFSVQSMCELPVFFFGRKILKIIGARNALLITFAVTAVRLLAYSLISNPVVAIFISMVHGVNYSLFIVAAVDYVHQIVPAKWKTTGQSLIWTFFMGIGMWAGSNIIGIVGEYLSMKGATFICSIMTFILFFCTFVIFRYFRVQKPAQTAKH